MDNSINVSLLYSMQSYSTSLSFILPALNPMFTAVSSSQYYHREEVCMFVQSYAALRVRVGYENNIYGPLEFSSI